MAADRLLCALLALGLLTACGGTPQMASRAPSDAPVRLMMQPVTAGSAALTQAVAPGTYLVGVGDVVQIHAVEAPELTLPAGYVVDGDGTITVPFLGQVPAADRPIAAIRADLVQRLRAYFPTPQVDFRVTEFQSRHATVVGQVARPARLVLTTPPKTVIDAINEAGGVDGSARSKTVTILRAGREIPVDMDGFLSRGMPLPLLQDGDVVQVAGASFAADLGLVAPVQPAPAQTLALYVPGAAEAQALSLGAQGASVAQVLAHASPASTMAVHVLRPANGTVQGYSFAPADARDPRIGGQFALHPGDAMILRDPAIAGSADDLAALAPIAAQLLPR